MPVFESESEFLRTVEEHDSLVRQFLCRDLEFADFLKAYDNFYWRYALDGHESDRAELSRFDRHQARVEVHRVIAEGILSKICSESDAQLESFMAAGRFGPVEAAKRLRKPVQMKDDLLSVLP